MTLSGRSCRIQKQVPGSHHASAEDDHFQVKKVDEIGARDTQSFAGFFEDFHCRAVAAHSSIEDVF